MQIKLGVAFSLLVFVVVLCKSESPLFALLLSGFVFYIFICLKFIAETNFKNALILLRMKNEYNKALSYLKRCPGLLHENFV